MMEIDQALSLVLDHARPLAPETASVATSLHRVLAENIVADVDAPPHTKALVDGFAIRVADAGRELLVREQVLAGGVPTQSVDPGTCVQVMTGAPLPEGAEAMVMVEDTKSTPEGVLILAEHVAAGDHLMRQAKIFARGETVLESGSKIGPSEVALLSEVGRDLVSCHRRPRVAVLPTGDELVSVTEQPGHGMIRNSNGPMLRACAERAGSDVTLLAIGRDDVEQLTGQVRQGLEADVLVLSGGVSAGVRDLVPGVLEKLGVQPVFHKVALKPGKPLWFGVQTSAAGRCLVFGLPGNPVSSLVCFELFVLPALHKLAGGADAPERRPARLANGFTHRGQRVTYHPGRCQLRGGRWFVEPLTWAGSADMRTLCQANCLIRFPLGNYTLDAGAKVEIHPLD